MSRVAIDVGGTFTDCLVLDQQGRLREFKALTTPQDPSRGLMECLEKAARAERKSLPEFARTLNTSFTARPSRPTRCSPDGARRLRC